MVALRALFSPLPKAAVALHTLTRHANMDGDVRDRLNGRLLAIMLLVMFGAFALVDLYQVLHVPGYSVPWYGYLIMLSAFMINRFLSNRIAAFITCLMFPAVLFFMYVRDPSIGSIRSLNYMVLGVFLATTVMRRTEAVAFTVLVLAAMLTAPFVVPLDPSQIPHFVTPLVVTALGAVLSVTLSIHSDYVERRRREQIDDNRRRFQDLVESSIDFIWEMGTDGRYTYASPQVKHILGYESSAVLGRTPADFMVPAEAADLRGELERLCALCTPVSRLRIRMRHSDGRDVILETSAVPVVDTNGAHVGCRGIARDITQREWSENQMYRNELRYRRFVTNFRGIAYETQFGIGPTLAPVLFQGAVEDITGYTTEHFASGTVLWQNLIHPDDVSLVRRHAEALASSSGYVADSEYRIRHAGGAYRWVRDIAQRVDDGSGERTVIQGALFDITENHLLHERLRQSEKMEAVGQLAGGVAHDFNNQLAGIVGFADILRLDLENNAELKRFAENIITAARRAADLTTQLLAFARKGKYLNDDIDVHRIIVEVVTLLRRSVDKRIEMHQQFDAQSPVIRGDPTQIQNALLNLAINARDAMPDGGRLTFKTRIVDLDDAACRRLPFALAPGAFVAVSVSDTGTGIPPDVLPHIFEPFFTTKKEGKGTGMGLASVYGSATAHRGAIEVASEPGKGSTFTLLLPSVQPSAAAQGSTVEQRARTGVAARVLLVDDEDLVLEMTAAMLRKMGHTVTAVDNGAKAVEILRASPQDFDLVILDMIMPGMSGVETFDAIRAIRGDIRALISSGYSIDNAAQDVLSRGASGFVQKPFQRSELAAQIEHALSSESTGVTDR